MTSDAVRDVPICPRRADWFREEEAARAFDKTCRRSVWIEPSSKPVHAARHGERVHDVVVAKHIPRLYFSWQRAATNVMRIQFFHWCPVPSRRRVCAVATDGLIDLEFVRTRNHQM